MEQIAILCERDLLTGKNRQFYADIGSTIPERKTRCPRFYGIS